MSDHLVLDHIIVDATAWIEIGAGFLAYFILSFLWWGPLFGRPWARAMGMDPDMRPDARTMGKAMALQVVCTALSAFVLWHVMEAFTMRLAVPGDDGLTVGLALQGSFYMWLGFIVPMQLARLAWEKASWTLFGINAAGHLVGLLAMGAVFALL